MVKSDKRSLRFYLGTALVTLFAVLCVAPLLYMIMVSFADTTTLYIRWQDIKWFDFSNYEYLFVSRNFGRPLWNSIVMVVLSCVLVDIISCTMAYGFEKKPIPGKNVLFNIVLATMMIPTQVVFISLFVMMRQMKLLNTYIALVIPLIGAFGIFLMRQFIHGVPNELMEAAEIDGCGELGIFLRIVLPMVRPAVITLTVFTFNSAWNSFMWPLIATTKSEMYPLTVAMSTLTSYFETNYGLTMAASTISFAIPFLLYCFLQKEFVEGIALGGLKG